MNKAKLDQVFSLNSSDEVFSFMKDYAYKNQDLSAALIRHFFLTTLTWTLLGTRSGISYFPLMRAETDGGHH